MTISEELKQYINRNFGKFANRLHFISPIKNQFPIRHDVNDNCYGDTDFTNMFYTPTKGFGLYRIYKKTINVAIVPIKNDEVFEFDESNGKIVFQNNIPINEIPTVIKNLLPYIKVANVKCYYDILRKSFTYDHNNVCTYTDNGSPIKAYLDHLKRHNYKSYAIVYIKPSFYES